MAEGDRLAARLQEEKEKLERDLQKQQSQIHESQQSLMKERAGYSALAAQAHVAVEARRKELDEKAVLIQQLEATLSHIYSSHGWKALTVYYQLRNKFLPEGTKRREIAKAFWKFLGKSSSSLPAGKNGAVQSAGTLSVAPVVIKPIIKEEDVAINGATVSEAPEITYGGNGVQSARTSNVDPVIVKAIIEGERCSRRRSDNFSCDSDKEWR